MLFKADRRFARRAALAHWVEAWRDKWGPSSDDTNPGTGAPPVSAVTTPEPVEETLPPREETRPPRDATPQAPQPSESDRAETDQSARHAVEEAAHPANASVPSKWPPKEDAKRSPGETLRERVGEVVEERDEPDVTLHVPHLKVDDIQLDVENLRARVSLQTAVANLVTVNAGVDAMVDRLKLGVKGVDAKALLRVRLEKIVALIERALTTIDKNPELLASLLRPVEETAGQLGSTVERTAPKLLEGATETARQAVPKTVRTVEATVEQVGKDTQVSARDSLPPKPAGIDTAVEMAGAAEDTRGKGSPEFTAPEMEAAVEKAGVTDPEVEMEAAVEKAGATDPEVAGQSSESHSTVHPGTKGDGEAEAPGEKQSRPFERLRQELLGAGKPPLEGWKTVGGGKAAAVNHGLVTEPGNDLGLAFHTQQMPGDFVLDVDFRLLESNARSPLYLRMRDPRLPVPDPKDPSKRHSYENPAYVPVNTGIAVDISHSGAGTIGGAGTLETVPLNPGEWHHLHVEVMGQQYNACLDDKQVVQFTNTDVYRGKSPEEDSASGYLGIGIDGGWVEFANLVISDLDVGKSAAGKSEAAPSKRPANLRAPVLLASLLSAAVAPTSTVKTVPRAGSKAARRARDVVRRVATGVRRRHKNGNER